LEQTTVLMRAGAYGWNRPPCWCVQVPADDEHIADEPAPVDVLGPPPEQPAAVLRPARLCPSLALDTEAVDEIDRQPDDWDAPAEMGGAEADLDWVSPSRRNTGSTDHHHLQQKTPPAAAMGREISDARGEDAEGATDSQEAEADDRQDQ